MIQYININQAMKRYVDLIIWLYQAMNFSVLLMSLWKQFISFGFNSNTMPRCRRYWPIKYFLNLFSGTWYVKSRQCFSVRIKVLVTDEGLKLQQQCLLLTRTNPLLSDNSRSNRPNSNRAITQLGPQATLLSSNKRENWGPVSQPVTSWRNSKESL